MSTRHLHDIRVSMVCFTVAYTFYVLFCQLCVYLCVQVCMQVPLFLSGGEVFVLKLNSADTSRSPPPSSSPLKGAESTNTDVN